MRVLLRELDAGGAANNDPCGTYAWGETEDYDVKIVNGVVLQTFELEVTAVPGTTGVTHGVPAINFTS